MSWLFTQFINNQHIIVFVHLFSCDVSVTCVYCYITYTGNVSNHGFVKSLRLTEKKHDLNDDANVYISMYLFVLVFVVHLSVSVSLAIAVCWLLSLEMFSHTMSFSIRYTKLSWINFLQNMLAVTLMKHWDIEG